MRVSIAITVLLTSVLASLPTLATTATAQASPASGTPEHDNSVFHYARLELDGTRARSRLEGTWDGEGWIGTDVNRLWWRTIGETDGGTVSDAEGQVAYGRYLGSFFDVQGGYRQVVRPGGSGYFMLGIEGLTPYRFEVAVDLFAADRGRLSARTDLAYDLLWTQRLISRPSVRVDWFAAPDEALGQQAGIGGSEFRFPTRYEFSRSFAPYVEIRRSRRSGARASLAGTSTAESPWTLRAGFWLLY